MNKTIMFLGVLAVGFANAQQDGKVGVNTDQPTATLSVKSKTGTNAATKNLELQNANEEKLVTVLDNGNVGIGTDVPVANLQIDYEGDNPIKIRHKTLPLTDGNLRSEITFADKDDNIYGYLGDISRLQRLGLIGVNYSTVLGANKRASFDNPSATNILATSSLTTNAEDDNNRLVFTTTNQQNPQIIDYYTTVDNWGRWHIGWNENNIDTRSIAKLSVKGIGNTKNTKTFELLSQNTTKLFTILDNGNVGIGTDAPEHGLHISNKHIHPISIQNMHYEHSNPALNSVINFRDKNNILYGYIGDGSGHRRITLGAKEGYEATVSVDNASLWLNPNGDVDRIIIETLGESNAISRTYIDKTGKWRVGISNNDADAKFQVGGSIKVSSSSDICDNNNKGTIRFANNKFQGCTNTGWKDLHN